MLLCREDHTVRVTMHDGCTMKLYAILDVKNALVKSVYRVT